MLIFVLIIAPEALASLRAVKLDYSISSGVIKPIAVTANKGITFEILPKNEYTIGIALSLNRAIQAIERTRCKRRHDRQSRFHKSFSGVVSRSGA